MKQVMNEGRQEAETQSHAVESSFLREGTREELCRAGACAMCHFNNLSYRFVLFCYRVLQRTTLERSLMWMGSKRAGPLESRLFPFCSAVSSFLPILLRAWKPATAVASPYVNFGSCLQLPAVLTRWR